MRLDKKAKTWLYVCLILLLLIAATDRQPDEKKESAAEWGRVGIGVAAITLGLVFAPFTEGLSLPATAIGLTILGGGGVFSGVAGLLTPDKGIPVWVWIAGFVVLIMIIKKKKE